MAQHGESEKHGPRLYCQPHDGSRTASFLPFKQAFMVGANAHYLNDDDFSMSFDMAHCNSKWNRV